MYITEFFIAFRNCGKWRRLDCFPEENNDKNTYLLESVPIPDQVPAKRFRIMGRHPAVQTGNVLETSDGSAAAFRQRQRPHFFKAGLLRRHAEDSEAGVDAVKGRCPNVAVKGRERSLKTQS